MTSILRFLAVFLWRKPLCSAGQDLLSFLLYSGQTMSTYFQFAL